MDYDSLDRVLRQEDPDSGLKTVEYNDGSRTQRETDAEGHPVTIEYDTLGRVQTKTSAVGVSSSATASLEAATTTWAS